LALIHGFDLLGAESTFPLNPGLRVLTITSPLARETGFAVNSRIPSAGETPCPVGQEAPCQGAVFLLGPSWSTGRCLIPVRAANSPLLTAVPRPAGSPRREHAPPAGRRELGRDEKARPPGRPHVSAAPTYIRTASLSPFR
jgi:hypothetical protein